MKKDLTDQEMWREYTLPTYQEIKKEELAREYKAHQPLTLDSHRDNGDNQCNDYVVEGGI